MNLMLNKLVLITGASKGIGKATALTFFKHGAKVIINYRHDESAANDILKIIKDNGGWGKVIKADVSKIDHIKAIFKEIRKNGQALDCIVNNAGIIRDNLLLMTPENDYDTVMNTNLKGTFFCTQYAAKNMMRQGGSIINVSSIIGRYGNSGQISYAASKSGIIGLTLSAAKELGQFGIRVNAVAPGFITSDMTKDLPDSVRNKMKDSICLKNRLGTPEDVANVILFLASDLSSYVSGQVIGVDGCQII